MGPVGAGDGGLWEGGVGWVGVARHGGQLQHSLTCLHPLPIAPALSPPSLPPSLPSLTHSVCACSINHVKVDEAALTRYLRGLHLDLQTAVLEPELKHLVGAAGGGGGRLGVGG